MVYFQVSQCEARVSGVAWRCARPRRQPVGVGPANPGSGSSVRGSYPWRCAVLRAMQLRLRPPKGPGELAMPVFMPALRGLGDSKWNRARPLPFLTRSCGSVLRRIRSCQASSWGVRRRRGGSNWANEISRDEVPRARCGRSAERRLREAGGGAAGGGYFWPCARYSCGAHARGFRKRSILRLWFMTEGGVWPRRKPVGVGTADRRQQVAPGPARQAQPACPAALVRVKLKTLPLPGSLCTRMVSPMAWRISLAMDRPRPEPELPCDLSTL